MTPTDCLGSRSRAVGGSPVGGLRTQIGRPVRVEKGAGREGRGGEEKVSRYWVYRVESGVRGTQASFASLINGAVAFGDVISSIDISENRARARGSRGLSETGPNRPSRRPLDDSAVAGGGTWLQARLAGICTSGVFRRQLLAPLPRGSP